MSGIAFVGTALAISRLLLLLVSRLPGTPAYLLELSTTDRARGLAGPDTVALRQSAQQAVLVFGSSIVETGLDLRAFAAGASANSQPPGATLQAHNFGLSAADPETQYLLARRITDAFSGSAAKVALTLVEFTPFQSTEARKRDRNFRKYALLKRAQLMSAREWMDLAVRDPGAAVESVGILALGPVPPETASQILGGFLLPAKTSHVTREERMRRDLAWRSETCDLLDLHFDPESLAYVIRTVRELQKISQHVRVFVPPSNREWVERSQEGRRRLAEAEQALALATGASIDDYSDDPRFVAGDFSDVTHLRTAAGKDRFSRVLGRSSASALGLSSPENTALGAPTVGDEHP